MLLNVLTKNLDRRYDTHRIDYKELEKVRKYTSNEYYFHFITKISDGGYLHGYALHLYSYNSILDFNNIRCVNDVLNAEFGDIFNGLYSFGEDIFGNQFTFGDDGIVFFNIGTGGRELLGDTFEDWLKILEDDILYFSGKKFCSCLEETVGVRLCPKVPFVIGGEYEVDNLYQLNFPQYISLNASIAKQIYNLPDGTSIKLVVK